MALFQFQRPSAEEHQALMQQLGPLPIKGMAWANWVKILAWVVLGLIGLQLVRTAATVGSEVNPVVAGCLLVTFGALALVARYMAISETIVTEQGIKQTWITRREVGWDEIQFAKFIPMIASKRLICFTGRGRPVVFQAGTQPLQIAFAQIAVTYRKR